MLDFIFIFICCILGNLIGNLIFYLLSVKFLKKSIFSKSDFINIDDDFFSDDSNNSITDINLDTYSNNVNDSIF